jgi:L-alanine-DL-glutamate epimerase-like enolase superfamily enzyme
MRITRLTTAVIEANFDWTLMKVETDEGVTGYGEAYFGPGLPAVIREYAALIEGEDLTSIDVLVRKMKAASVHVWPGLATHAVCGIEAALLDALGKRYRLPLWQILGGKYRDRVSVYVDCHAGESLESITPLLVPRTPSWQAGEAERVAAGAPSVKHRWDQPGRQHLTPEAYARRAAEMAARGFPILKFDIDVPMPFPTDQYNRDLSPAEVDYAASLVAAVRQAVGPGVGVAIDCHWNYGVGAAVELARALEPYRLAWFEDPVPPENLDALAQVQRATRLPIATGENHYHRIDFERLIREAGLRLLAPDVQKVGLWEGRKLADLADMHYVNLAFHNVSGPIGTMAGVHLSAAVPNFLALEWHAADVPFFDALVRGLDGPLIENGSIRVPDAPGLGIELDEDVAWRYRKPGERFFE